PASGASAKVNLAAVVCWVLPQNLPQTCHRSKIDDPPRAADVTFEASLEKYRSCHMDVSGTKMPAVGAGVGYRKLLSLRRFCGGYGWARTTDPGIMSAVL